MRASADDRAAAPTNAPPPSHWRYSCPTATRQVTDFNLSRVSRTDNVASVQSMVANNPRWQPPEVGRRLGAGGTGVCVHRRAGCGTLIHLRWQPLPVGWCGQDRRTGCCRSASYSASTAMLTLVYVLKDK